MRYPGKCRPRPTGRPDTTYGHLQVLSLPLEPKSDLSRDCPGWAALSPASRGLKASKASGAQPRRIPAYLRPSLQPRDNSQNRIVQPGPRGLALQALWGAFRALVSSKRLSSPPCKVGSPDTL